MLIPYFRNVPTVKCTRCELRHPEKESECPHCQGLSDSEVRDLKLRIERETGAHSSLGKIMFGMAAIIALITLLFSVQW